MLETSQEEITTAKNWVFNAACGLRVSSLLWGTWGYVGSEMGGLGFLGKTRSIDLFFSLITKDKPYIVEHMDVFNLQPFLLFRMMNH